MAICTAMAVTLRLTRRQLALARKHSGSTTGARSSVSTSTATKAAINASGQIVGLYAGGPNGFGPHGFIYSRGTYTTLPTYLGGYFQVTSVNAAGQIVGSDYISGLPHGFVYSKGIFTPPRAATRLQRRREA
jgi:hypothetical protein